MKETGELDFDEDNFFPLVDLADVVDGKVKELSGMQAQSGEFILQMLETFRATDPELRVKLRPVVEGCKKASEPGIEK